MLAATPERQLLREVNVFRAEHGISALQQDVPLNGCAERHSRKMARQGRLFHSPTAQLRRCLSGRDWSLAGENVGTGKSVRSIQRAFRASPEHRRVELNPAFRWAGVGVVRHDGVLWVTLVAWG